MSSPTHRLVRPDVGRASVELDDHQRAVVDHGDGPLLVLAGPGTGKTTTMVEAIAERVEGRGDSPDSVLALTFSRKAAEQLGERVTARLGRTTGGSVSATFHSFAYQLVRAYAPADLYDAPLRLLSAPEQDVVLRELLTEHEESVTWPRGLRAALGTKGFAREVQSVLARAREKGLDGVELERLGHAEEIPEFVAAGRFLEHYLTNLDHQGAVDYADLIRRAVVTAEEHRTELRGRFQHVFVDEYQDTDPGQVALLRALAGDGRNLVAVGDPHQSIYGFRGAEVRGILEFPTEFETAAGQPAPVVALRTTRRFGNRLLRSAQQVAGRLALPGSIPLAAREAFLTPVSAAPVSGRVEVLTFDTERAEAEHIADLLRRAHLEDGVPWDQMAVLVRSGRATIPVMLRSLSAAGVPVEVAADEVLLSREPAVQPLLDAVRVVLNLNNHDPDHVDYTDAGRAEALLTGPLGGLDAGAVRRLARALRLRERAGATAQSSGPTRGSRELLRLAVTDFEFLADLPGPEAEQARKLVRLLARTREEMAGGASAEQVLWTLWSGTRWPQRLARQAQHQGAPGRRAHADLDAVLALFEQAARSEEQRDHLGVRNFLATLEAQRIPADTLAERGIRGAAVRLMTAHRAKGLEWRVVVVAHVQEETWPDLRRRTGLLRPDRIGRDGIVPPLSTREMLLEERRLFYVACTRAREHLIVTAVESREDEGELPSRFLDELEVERVRLAGRPRRPLSMAGLVAGLRRTLCDAEASPRLRELAAARLAKLAGEGVASADPANWWGTRAHSQSPVPVRPLDAPVPLSASKLDSLMTCPLATYLRDEAGGAAISEMAANTGQLVHALAERAAVEDRAEGEVRLPIEVVVDGLMDHVDEVWGRLNFRTPWSRAREYDRVRLALTRFVEWHRSNPRRLVATEQRFRVEVDLPASAPGPPERVRLTGYADRLELAGDRDLVVVDLKTGRSKPTGPAVTGHRQLALYQLATEAGGFDGLAAAVGVAGFAPGGAELLQVGLIDDKGATVQHQESHHPSHQTRQALLAELGQAAGLLRNEEFPAQPGGHCDHCSFISLCPAKGAGTVFA